MRKFFSVHLQASCWAWVCIFEKESAAAQAGLYLAELVGTLFIDMLKMVIIPLVFSSIAVGVANLRMHRQMHACGKRRWAFFCSRWRWPLSLD